MRRFSTVLALAAAFALAALANVAHAHPPWGIAADGRGVVYFSALETVWKIDESGRLSVFRPGVSGRHTHELTLDEGGNLYGEDLTYEPAGERWITAVWKATPSGEVSFLLAPTDSPPRGTSIWRDREGNTYSVQSDNPARELLLLKRGPGGQVSLLMGGKTSFERGRQVILLQRRGRGLRPRRRALLHGRHGHLQGRARRHGQDARARRRGRGVHEPAEGRPRTRRAARPRG